ncbi:sulfite exporter TauE/SafE family protein [Pontiellaceae bacterium B1224]|nr:sulfite exporter TauE/SafE family protein [Pontiellaceae bacterium B1224]
MTELPLIATLVFVVAVAMTMVGKGGGNFYVVILAMSGIPMHEAATTGQFILFAASVAAMLIFHQKKSISWPLAFSVGGITAVSALAGGLLSHYFSGYALKLVFAVMLLASGGVMLLPKPNSQKSEGRKSKGFGMVSLASGGEIYRVNLWIALPVTILTGLGSGMVGVSGGSFLVPLMVVACGIPMQLAVGTSASLIAAIALMGFAGHAVHGDFNPAWALPLAVVTIIGGALGGRLALKAKPKHLKQLFAYTNWVAAGFMIFNALHGGA